MWAEELPNILWAHRTSAARPTGFTAFKMLFEEEAVTPEEAQVGAVCAPPKEEAEQVITAQDLQEENHLRAVRNMVKYHKEIKAWRDKKLKCRAFSTGNMVLR